MTNSHKLKTDLIQTVLTWAARLTGVASFGILTLFVISHVVSGEMNPDSQEMVGLMLFPGGVMLGLVLAFRFDLVGAVTAIVSCAAFYVWHLNGAGNFPAGIYFMLFTSPAILYLISGTLRRTTTSSGYSSKLQNS